MTTKAKRRVKAVIAAYHAYVKKCGHACYCDLGPLDCIAAGHPAIKITPLPTRKARRK